MYSEDFTAATIKPCDDCGQDVSATYLCASCAVTYCDHCWSIPISHRRGTSGPNGLAHEKSDTNIAQRLENAFTPPRNIRQANQLHIDDSDTTWLSFTGEPTNFPSIQDHDRFTALIQDSFTGVWSERWPQIVSFIGQTGIAQKFAYVYVTDESRGWKKHDCQITH